MVERETGSMFDRIALWDNLEEAIVSFTGF